MTNPPAQVNARALPTPLRVCEGMMRVSILPELPSLLQEMGQDPARLLGELGLDPVQCVDPENPLPFRVVGNVLSHCVMRTGCAHFGLLLGQRGGTATLGKVGLLARSSPDVDSALRNLIKHLHHHDQGAVPSLSVNGNTALFGYAIYEKEVRASDQIYAGAMAIAFRIMRELCGSGWRPSEVWLPFRKPRDAAPFRQFFQTPLRFGAEQGALDFPAAWLNHSLQSADHEVQHQVETLLEAYVRSHHPRAACRARAAGRRATFGGPSGQLRCEPPDADPATAAGRYVVPHPAEGDREVQLEVACQMLRDTDNLIDHIATTLGYAGASPFTRAFKTWTGHTPADWRNRNAAGPARP